MTKLLSQNRLQLQLLFALVAVAALLALTIWVVLRTVQQAESYVTNNTLISLQQALSDLNRESLLQRQESASWKSLPPNAQDITLHAISQTVLASYPGVEGGFWLRTQFVGYAYPTHDGGTVKSDVPAAEKVDIEATIQEALQRGSSRRILRGRQDVVIITANKLSYDNDGAVWAMKRLPGLADPGLRWENSVLIVLVAVALLGATGVLATGIGLARGIHQITQGLASLNDGHSWPLKARQDELGLISAAINDMVQVRQRLEADLRREDRVRTIGRLAGQIAHEIRNPLNSMRLSLQMLASRHQERRLKTEDFAVVVRELDRINSLLSDLLSFQQPRQPQIAAHDVCGLVAESAAIVTQQYRQRRARLRIHGASGVSVLVDADFFKQILLNLLLNAVEAVPEQADVQIAITPNGHQVAVEVIDAGPGLSHEQQEHLFERFYTTKASGHGMGLAISQELAQAMGATLSYRAESTRGATFVLEVRRSS
jgi:signal transduction histidine kinase